MQNESRFTVFTAENCAKEPIHIPGAIQDHGILLVLRISDFTILQVSANCYDLLGIHPDELLHQPLSQLMDLQPLEEASKRLGDRVPRLLNPIPIKIKTRSGEMKFDGIIHRSGRLIILELEKHIPVNEGYGGFGGFYEAIREIATRLMHAESLDEVMLTACEEIKKLTEYSRVLVYKFDEEWNGKVIAEAKEPHVKSLLHHRFPSTDIPKQARDLYTVNWLRIIPNVDYKPSVLIPLENPITDKPLDLSNSVLRSVSPIHLEYMRNMGQSASMSISLLKDKKLWGLISCHNEEAKYLKYDTRIASEFVGQMVSAQISARAESVEVNHAAQLKTLFAAALQSTDGLTGALGLLRSQGAALLAATDAPGAAICDGDQCYLMGSTPKVEEIQSLVKTLDLKGERLFFTQNSSEVFPASGEFKKKASGVLAITLPTGPSILWFRPEMTEQIVWSGNPELSQKKEATGSLYPRKSFETWMESVEGRSRGWSQDEIDSASAIFDALSGMITGRGETGEKRKKSDFEVALRDSIQNTAKKRNGPGMGAQRNDTAETVEEAVSNSRTLLEGFDEFSVLFLDIEGKIKNWSAGAKRLLGFGSEQALGNGIDLFLSNDEIARDKHKRVLKFVAEQHRCEEELWLYRADRSSFWGKIMVAAVRDTAARLIGYSIVIQDVTKEKAAEEELRATKVSAEAANQAKTSFLANISHEIRTPLGAVLGFADLLRDPKLSEEEKDNLSERIRRNGDQLKNLINDLLDLTKVEANRLDIELIEFDLAQLLVDVTETLKVKAAEKSVAFGTDILGDIPRFIISDPTRLRQILLNIINNAIKFTPSGGMVRISVSLDQQSLNGKLMIRVSDTGPGMSEQQMAKLFQPFVQADVSTTRKFGGTGLGLFVSQRLARLLRGDVSIENSELGKGSTFLISIDPGKNSKPKNFSSLSTSVSEKVSRQTAGDDLKDKRVLLVDDSPDNRHLIQQYLKKSGAIVESAENGREGVDKALGGEFDIVLMDIQMPVLDGNGAMKELKARGYKVPVFALTAHAMNEERQHSLQLGFSDYLTKPIKRDELIARLSEALRNPV